MSTSPTQVQSKILKDARTRSKEMDALVADFETEAKESTKSTKKSKAKAILVHRAPVLDKFIAAPIAYGLAEGIVSFGHKGLNRVRGNATPKFGTLTRGLFGTKLGRVGMAATVVIGGGYYWFGGDDSKFEVGRNDSNKRLDITSYHDETGLTNYAQSYRLEFNRKEEDGKTTPVVLRLGNQEESGSLVQFRSTLINEAKESVEETSNEVTNQKDIAQFLIQAHSILINKGDTAEANTILRSLKDLAELKDREVNELVADYAETFSSNGSSKELKELRLRLKELKPTPDPNAATSPTTASDPMPPSPPLTDLTVDHKKLITDSLTTLNPKKDEELVKIYKALQKPPYNILDGIPDFPGKGAKIQEVIKDYLSKLPS